MTGDTKTRNAAIGIGSALYMLAVPRDISGLSDEQRSAALDRSAEEFVETLRILGFEIVAVAEGESS